MSCLVSGVVVWCGVDPAPKVGIGTPEAASSRCQEVAEGGQVRRKETFVYRSQADTCCRIQLHHSIGLIHP